MKYSDFIRTPTNCDESSGSQGEGAKNKCWIESNDITAPFNKKSATANMMCFVFLLLCQRHVYFEKNIASNVFTAFCLNKQIMIFWLLRHSYFGSNFLCYVLFAICLNKRITIFGYFISKCKSCFHCIFAWTNE